MKETAEFDLIKFKFLFNEWKSKSQNRRYLQYTYMTKKLYPEYICNFYKSIRKRQTMQFLNRQMMCIPASQKGTSKCPISI